MLNQISEDKIKNANDLLIQIQKIELKQLEEESLLKKEVMNMLESIKPYTVLKSTFLDFKKDLTKNAIGQTVGYLSKEILVGKSHNPIKNLFGSAIQYGISSIISLNPEIIKTAKTFVLKIITPKSKKTNEHNY